MSKYTGSNRTDFVIAAALEYSVAGLSRNCCPSLGGAMRGGCEIADFLSLFCTVISRTIRYPFFRS